MKQNNGSREENGAWRHATDELPAIWPLLADPATASLASVMAAEHTVNVEKPVASLPGLGNYITWGGCKAGLETLVVLLVKTAGGAPNLREPCVEYSPPHEEYLGKTIAYSVDC